MTSLYKDMPASRCADASQKTAGFFVELPLTLIGQIKRAFVLLSVWQKRHNERSHLMRLEDRLLADIGMSEAVRDQEASKPFWKE